MANERAIHCEKLKSDLELAAITLDSTAKNRLDEQLEVINRIRDACILAYRGLFQTGLLAKDFMWFIHESDADPDAVMASTSNAIANVPKVPDWLRDKRSPETKGIMNLITNKRWKNILPLCREYSRILSIIMRRFADELHHSLLHFEEPSGASGKWYKQIEQGVLINGVTVKLNKREATILLEFCKAPKKFFSYTDLVDSWEPWKSDYYTGDKKSQDSTRGTGLPPTYVPALMRGSGVK